MKFSKKLGTVCIFVGIALLSARLYLPYFLINYATQQINKIPGYRAKITDIDVFLWKGSYVIKQMSLHKIKGDIPVPFFHADTITLAVEWRALLHGSLVAKALIYKPALNFVIEPTGKNEQLSINDEWEYVAKTLFPLNFNKISIDEGEISLHSFQGKPPFQLSLTQVQFEIRNLQKVTGTDSLFSTFEGTGRMYDGDFFIEGSVDPQNAQPTFILKSSLKSMNVQKANNFLLHFTNIDVKKGNFSLYSEIAAAQGKVHGYAKPLIKNLKILNLDEPMNPIEFLYKGFLELGSKIVTNQKKHTIATKINFKGNFEKPQTSSLSIIGYFMRHAFVQALLPQIDNTVEMKDVILKK